MTGNADPAGVACTAAEAAHGGTTPATRRPIAAPDLPRSSGVPSAVPAHPLSSRPALWPPAPRAPTPPSWEDELLLEQLHALLADIDPVPPSLIEQARAAFRRLGLRPRS